VAMVGLILVTAQAHWLIPVLILGSSLPILKLQARHNVDRYALVRAHTAEGRLIGYVAGLLTGREAAKEVRLFQLGPYLTRRWKTIHERQRREVMEQRRKQRIARGMIDSLPTAVF